MTSPFPRVLDAMRGRVTLERQGLPVTGQDRVAVVAHYSTSSQATKSFERLISSIQGAGYVVVVSSTCTDPAPLRWSLGRPDEVTVLRRPNVGYDFGSWAVALEAFPDIRQSRNVIVANDSMVGPFLDLRAHLERFEASRSDAWGLTSNYQFEPHLQSYFLGFRESILDSKQLRQFWNDIRIEPTKDQVIQRYELGLSRLLLAEGYILDAEFDAARVVGHDFNPVIIGWNRLLELGYPFVKRELVTNPSVVHGAGRLPSIVREMFGESVEEWL